MVLLFDFDSTIFYLFKDFDRTDLIEKLNSTLKKYGIKDIVDRNFFNAFLYAKNNKECLTKVEEIIEEIELKRIDEGTLLKDFLEVFPKLYDKYQIGVVSNNSIECFYKFMDKYLKGYNIKFFGRVKDNPNLLKPNPYLINEAIKYFNLDKEEFIYIGDNVTDYLAASSIPIKFIGLAEEERKYVAFMGLNKDFKIVRGYKELEELLL